MVISSNMAGTSRYHPTTNGPRPDRQGSRTRVTARPMSFRSGRGSRDRFVAAFRAQDLQALIRLLREDALLTMPPYPAGFEGPTAIGRFFATVPAGGRLDRIRLVVTRANGQPALAAYGPVEDGRRHAYGVMVLTMQDDAISAITGFLGPEYSDTSPFLPAWSHRGWR